MAKEQLLRGLAFYGAYHKNPWNQLIHVVFVRASIPPAPPPPPPPTPPSPTHAPNSR